MGGNRKPNKPEAQASNHKTIKGELIRRQETPLRSSRVMTINSIFVLVLIFSFAASSGTLYAQASETEQKPRVVLPLVTCWYKGKVAYYIQTEASDPSVAEQMGVNYVPRLANAISAQAVDDIYVVTNFKQGNVIPSAPIPAGIDGIDLRNGASSGLGGCWSSTSVLGCLYSPDCRPSAQQLVFGSEVCRAQSRTGDSGPVREYRDGFEAIYRGAWREPGTAATTDVLSHVDHVHAS